MARERRELKQDGAELRREKRDLQADKNDIKRGRRDHRHDRRKVKREQNGQAGASIPAAESERVKGADFMY